MDLTALNTYQLIQLRQEVEQAYKDLLAIDDRFVGRSEPLQNLCEARRKVQAKMQAIEEERLRRLLCSLQPMLEDEETIEKGQS